MGSHRVCRNTGVLATPDGCDLDGGFASYFDDVKLARERFGLVTGELTGDSHSVASNDVRSGNRGIEKPIGAVEGFSGLGGKVHPRVACTAAGEENKSEDGEELLIHAMTITKRS